MNLVQVQEHLKGMPTQVLMGYANGQNPQVPPYIALGELNRRKQMEQQPAQPPQGSVKDQIEQSLMQPQQLPGLAAQGVPVPQPPQPQGMPAQMPQQLAGAAPQQAPTRMAAGGLASVPMRKDMFNYAPGGIVAFANEENDQVVEEPKSDAAYETIYDRMNRLANESGTRFGPVQKGEGDIKLPGLKNPDFDENGLPRSKKEKQEVLAENRSIESQMASSAALKNRPLMNVKNDINPVGVERLEQYYKPRQPQGPTTLTQGAEARPQEVADPRAALVAALAAQSQAPEAGVASLPGARPAAAPSAPVASSAPSAPARPAAARPAAMGPAPASDPNDPLAFLRSQMNQAEPTYKSRADYIAEAAKTNPELLVKPEEGLRGLLEKLSQSQLDARERAMRGERGQQMSDISNALIAAGEATRGQKGSGIGSAFGGFGKTFNASSAAATERQAQRDALQQKQDLDMAKLQYEYAEKARARAMGDVTAEMNHDRNIADLQNKIRDDKRQAANYLAQDARTRDANASAAALRREQIQAIREGKPSPEQKLLTDVMARVNGDDRIAAISNSIKAGNLIPGTPDFNKAIRATEALAAPYYVQAGLKPPSAAQLAEDAAEPEKKGFWASLFGSSSKPAAVTSPPPNVQKVLDKYK